MGHFLHIAEAVLKLEGTPMKPRAIVDIAKDRGLFSDKLVGKTPHQTMKAKISVDILTKRTASKFVRTAPNTFYLRELLVDSEAVYNAVRLVPPKTGEVVVTFSSSILDEFGRFQGISRKWKPFLEKALHRGTLEFVERLAAENDEKRKQLLTYVLVTRGDKLLCFRRGTFNRVEDYLRGSLCVGFGGHVSNDDVTLYNHNSYRQIIHDNAARELYEELRLPEADKVRISSGVGMRFLGILNDDSSPTGRKHLAFVLRYEASASPEWARPLRGEKSITQLNWLELRRLGPDLREFEYWSQLCLTEFFTGAVRTQPSFFIRRKSVFNGPHLLCIVGGIGSGKSAATEILKKEFGYVEINSGRVVADLLGMPPVPTTDRSEFQKKSWAFIRKKSGPTTLASAILLMANQGEGRYLVDGIRQQTTLEALRKQAGSLRLAILFVHTSPHIAFQFYNERSGKTLGIHKFLKLCDAPVESEVKKLISQADAVLYNWTGKLSYEQAVRKLMRELKK